MFHVKHRGDYMNQNIDKYMQAAVNEAKIASLEGNVPVGAVIIKNNRIIASAHNKKNSSNVSVYHAEILSIVDACNYLNSWYLDDCVMYVTLKPCKMCEAAIGESRIKKVIYLLNSNYTDNLDINISNIDYVQYNDFYNYFDDLSSFFNNIRITNVSRETLDDNNQC